MKAELFEKPIARLPDVIDASALFRDWKGSDRPFPFGTVLDSIATLGEQSERAAKALETFGNAGHAFMDEVEDRHRTQAGGSHHAD